MLDAVFNLRGPLIKLIPFEWRMLNLIEKTMQTFINKKNKKYILLKELRDQLLKNLNKDDTSLYYETLLSMIEKHMVLFTSPKSALEGFAEYFFYTPPPDTTIVIKQLYSILIYESEHNPNHKDYLSQKDSKEKKEVDAEEKELKIKP